MKRFRRALTLVSVLAIGLLPGSLVRAENPVIASPSAVVELKDVYVRFKVKVFGLARIRGRFDRLHGELISAAGGDATAVRMRIDAGSVTTDDQWRDDYLRGATFFKAERYPHITFSGVCESHGENGAGRIVGELSLHGVTRQVVFDVREISATGGGGGYQATATIRRSEFGLNRLQHIVSDEVEIIVAMNTEAG